ncbi:MAG TPA: Y-family DNA polymerase [Candidatus Saccharimonadales bacterium]
MTTDKKGRIFVLIDCNNFFVSCERVFRPDLAERPVAVLSNNDGCIIARSNEVKVLGIPMGAPEFKYRKLLRANDVTLFSANFALYGDFSRRVVEVLRSYTPQIEVYSVDESFLEVSSLLIKDYPKWARGLCQDVFKQTGIPVSVGIAPTKTLAKAATELAKKDLSFGGALSLVGLRPAELKAHLEKLVIEDVWGVGRRLGPKLRQLGLRTAWDLRQVGTKWAKQQLTIRGERTVRELKGETCFGLSRETVTGGQKSLAVTRSFGRRIQSAHELESAVASFATKAAARLRRKQQIAGALVVFITTGVGAVERFAPSTLVRLEYPTADTSQIVGTAVNGLDRIYNDNFSYKKAGVIMLDLRSKQAQQTTFGQIGQSQQLKRRDRLMRVMDQLNTRYGTRTLRTAREGQNLEAKWPSRQERRSPAYTTSWNQLASV